MDEYHIWTLTVSRNSQMLLPWLEPRIINSESHCKTQWRGSNWCTRPSWRRECVRRQKEPPQNNRAKDLCRADFVTCPSNGGATQDNAKEREFAIWDVIHPYRYPQGKYQKNRRGFWSRNFGHRVRAYRTRSPEKYAMNHEGLHSLSVSKHQTTDNPIPKRTGQS